MVVRHLLPASPSELLNRHDRAITGTRPRSVSRHVRRSRRRHHDDRQSRAVEDQMEAFAHWDRAKTAPAPTESAQRSRAPTPRDGCKAVSILIRSASSTGAETSSGTLLPVRQRSRARAGMAVGMANRQAAHRFPGARPLGGPKPPATRPYCEGCFLCVPWVHGVTPRIYQEDAEDPGARD
jgi:hypothetical protein